MENEQIRAFIAIELTSEVKTGLNQLQTKLKHIEHIYVKWVAPEGIHLTLKFLGNISLEKVSKITQVIERAVIGVTPFSIAIKDVGGFPNLKQPRVIWVGIGGDIKKIMGLQQRIDDGLIPLGFLKEKRAFTPHLTLARLREGASSQDRRAFGEKIFREVPQIYYEMNVEGINLMKSQLLPTGAVYSRLSEVKLQ